jgi:hypothetical protein
MTRICAIGDSHIAALMLGWKQIEGEYPDTRFTFFGAPRYQMKDLTVSHGALVPTTVVLRRYIRETGSTETIQGDYDFFLVYGLQFNAFQIQPLYEKYRAEGFAADDRAPISDNCFVRSLQGCLTRTLAVETIAKLRLITSAPIALMPQPFPGDNFARSKLLGTAGDRRDDKCVAELFYSTCRNLARDLELRLVLQPATTKSGPLQTKQAFCGGSVMLRGLDTPHPGRDSKHMNADYGLVMLREALSSLDIEKQTSGATS